MILRRVIDHFRKQEWTAIVIDFLIVVLGVFVGLQVSNWNAARANRAVADQHLAEIATDLQAHLDVNDQLIGSALLRVAAVDYVYEQAFGATLPTTLHIGVEVRQGPPAGKFPSEQLNNLMGAINLVRVSVGTRAGYDSLISAGHLSLIENKDLARSIQAYYQTYDDLLDTGRTVFRVFRTEGAAIYQGHGVSVFDTRPPDEIVAITRDNPDFAAYLRTQRELGILHAQLIDNLRAETEILLAEINAELEKRK